MPDSATPPAPKNRNGLILGTALGALALAVMAGLAVVVSGDGEDRPARAETVPTGSATAPTAPPERTASPSPVTPGTPGGVVLDPVHRWNVPGPPGWTSDEAGAGAAAYSVLQTTGPYDCGAQDPCVRGQFSIGGDPVPGDDARTVATSVIARYAPAIFGDLSGHKALPSGPVTVAGTTGYAVRWQVTTRKGDAGHALVVAVPAADGGFVLLYGGVDDVPNAPSPAVLDQIVGGIRPAA